MTRTEILSRLLPLLARLVRASGDPLSPDTPLISSGRIDSFHLVDLALEVEDAFGVVIADTELDGNTFDTPAALADLIAERAA